METRLRKIGNSAGVVLPRAVLNAACVAIGARMDVALEGERIVITPLATATRQTWAVAAAEIGSAGDTEAEEWLNVGNEDDSALRW